MEQVIEGLRLLADDLNIRDPRKLYQAAKRREYRDVTLQDARQALAKDVGRQLFAPKPRSLGKSAAEKPDTRLQADLIDFSKNAKSRNNVNYALLLTDVFTREAQVRGLRSKDPEEVNEQLNQALAALGIDDPEEDKGYVLTTDKGGEFSRVEDVLGEYDAIHRVKEGVNDISAVDRLTQTIKKNLAAKVARKGGRWDEHIRDVVDKYNETPHDAVFGPPEDVEKGGIQEFMVYKDNARKFMHNKRLTQRRKEDIQQAGAFRAPVPTGGRSFNPQYGNVQVLGRVQPGSQFVTNTAGRQTLLKEAQPVPRDSERPVGRLTDPQMGRRSRYQAQANQLEDFIAGEGGEMSLQALKGSLGRIGLNRFFRGLSMGLPAFLRLYGNMFILQNGQVRLRNYQSAAAPPPETREQRLARLMREDQERDAERARRREEQRRARLGGLRAVYGDRPS